MLVRLRERLRELWCSLYPILIPCLAGGLCWYLREFKDLSLFTTEEFTSALNSVITADSIILTLFGVLLPLLASAKSASKAVSYFFKTTGAEFSKQLKCCIFLSFLCLAACVGMYFVDLQYDRFLFPVWIGLFVAVLCRFYRFLALIIKMLFRD